MHPSAGVAGLADALGQAEFAQQPDVLPGDVELKPAQAVAGAGGVGVMVVVPALAETEDRYPPAVAGAVGAVEVAVAEGMGGGVHQPGHVIDEHQAQRDCPQHQPQPAAMDAGPFPIEVQRHPERQLQQQDSRLLWLNQASTP